MPKLSFIRSDLTKLAAYTPHPGGAIAHPLDRLDTNESPLDLPPEIKAKLATIYQQEIEANRYPDGGHFKLKEEIVAYIKESSNLNDAITAKNISVGNGSDELIRSLLIATCLGGQGSILVATPTFSMYGILAQTLGIPVITVGRNEQDFAIDLDSANSAISAKPRRGAIADTEDPPIRVVFVVHPNSPTGNSLSDRELAWLRNLPQDILVVIDEAYFEFSQTSVVSDLSKHPNWIILRTFSKAFRLASHRVGYAIASSDLIDILEKVRLPYNLPSFSQVAATIALQQRILILPLVQKIIDERKRMYGVLSINEQIKVWESQANFFYLRPTSKNNSSQQLEKIITNLKKQGTLIRHTGGGLRITIGTFEENTRTLERLAFLV